MRTSRKRSLKNWLISFIGNWARKTVESQNNGDPSSWKSYLLIGLYTGKDQRGWTAEEHFTRNGMCSQTPRAQSLRITPSMVGVERTFDFFWLLLLTTTTTDYYDYYWLLLLLTKHLFPQKWSSHFYTALRYYSEMSHSFYGNPHDSFCQQVIGVIKFSTNCFYWRWHTVIGWYIYLINQIGW